MAKKILIISSTPRKGGNSETLCAEFARGAKESGNDVETVVLRDLKIGECLGCGVCNTTHKCVQKDDMKAVLDKMVEADVIVMATPVYFYCASGRMKTFIDRCCPRYTEISNKDFYFLMSAAENAKHTFQGTVACFKGFLDCLESPRERGTVFAGGAWKLGEVKALPAMKEAYLAGKNA